MALGMVPNLSGPRARIMAHRLRDMFSKLPSGEKQLGSDEFYACMFSHCESAYEKTGKGKGGKGLKKQFMLFA